MISFPFRAYERSVYSCTKLFETVVNLNLVLQSVHRHDWLDMFPVSATPNQADDWVGHVPSPASMMSLFEKMLLSCLYPLS